MKSWMLAVLLLALSCDGIAQSRAKALVSDVDSILAERYYRNKGNVLIVADGDGSSHSTNVY